MSGSRVLNPRSKRSRRRRTTRSCSAFWLCARGPAGQPTRTADPCRTTKPASRARTKPQIGRAAMSNHLLRRMVRAALREELKCFVEKTFYTLEPGTAYWHNWHIDHLCWQLSRVASGELRRLIINVPPRSMKSITASVAFPAWVLGHDPTKRIICVSYAEDLARKLSVDTRTILDAPWYQDLFPRLELASKRPRNTELITTAQGIASPRG